MQAKVSQIETPDDLEEFVVEVDALVATNQANIVKIHASYVQHPTPHTHAHTDLTLSTSDHLPPPVYECLHS